MKSATVKDSSINQDGFTEIKTAIGESQIEKSVEISTFGHMGVPYDGMNAIRDYTGTKSVLAGVIQKAIEGLKKGESVMFSKTKDGIKANVFARENGDIEINGKDDNAVRYSVLEAQFNELNNKFNTLVGIYNSHVHPVPFAQVIFPASIPNSSATPMSGTASIADITGAKVDSVKLPKT